MSWRCGAAKDWQFFNQVKLVGYKYSSAEIFSIHIDKEYNNSIKFREMEFGNADSIDFFWIKDMSTILFRWENTWWREVDLWMVSTSCEQMDNDLGLTPLMVCYLQLWSIKNYLACQIFHLLMFDISIQSFLYWFQTPATLLVMKDSLAMMGSAFVGRIMEQSVVDRRLLA